jgi:molybdopterin-guanine dinucleotide biosynthesis protein B
MTSEQADMRVIGLAGWSGAGKTTLLVKLLPELAQRGLSVSTIKHAHHAFDIDQPGKDSYEHRRAGAREVLIASRRRWALVHELADEPEPSLAELLVHLSRVHVVIVEGFKRAGHPKIEVHRAANEKPLLFGTLPSVCGIAADGHIADTHLPVADLNNVPEVADLMLRVAAPLEQVLASLRAA